MPLAFSVTNMVDVSWERNFLVQSCHASLGRSLVSGVKRQM